LTTTLAWRDREQRAVTSLSVLVPTFQRCSSVRRLLQAIARQTLSASAFEVVVSVDGSTDGTDEMLHVFQADYRLRWCAGPHRGRAAACNEAIRLAEGALVVLLDDDMEPEPGLLAAHLCEHPAASRRCVMGAVPIAERPTDPPHVRYAARKFNEHLERLAEPAHRFVLRDFYSGNTSVARDELLAVGLYDEEFQSYGNEDLELAHRLVRNGVRLGFSPQARAAQHYDKSLERLIHDEIEKGRTAMLFIAKHPEAAEHLKLEALRRQPARQRALRRLAVRALRRWDSAPRVVVVALGAFARMRLPGSDRIYRATLETCYALGVERADRGMRLAIGPEVT
jgi:glycosyltransferase involved in cell wall biosynthesis